MNETNYGTLRERQDYVARLSKAPRARSARVEGGVLRLALATGATVEFPTREMASLAGASDEQLAGVRVVAGGSMLMWEEANLDLAVATVLEAATGLQNPAANGAKGGRARSEVKAAAVRANGAKGGRPRKTALV